MSLAFLKRKKNTKGLLKHMLLVAEKTDGDTFIEETLIAYDKNIKEKAKELAMKAFSKVDSTVLMKHLTYEGILRAR